MALTTITSHDGRILFDLPEFRQLSDSLNEYRHTKSPGNEQKYFDAIHDFLQFMNSYVCSIVAPNSLSPEEIIDELFVQESDTDRTVFANLLAMREYTMYLDNTLTQISAVKNADDVMLMLLADCEGLILYSENKINGIDAYGHYFSRNYESPRDIFWAINQIFALPQSVSQNYIDVRELQPLTTFLIRQFIETTINYALGIDWIEDKNGHPAHGLITPTINFFCDTTKHTNFTINQPLNKDSLLSIYKWSSEYVHTGLFSPYFVMYYAWFYISRLITPVKNPINIFTGKSRISFMHGDIQISNYNNLKAAYEQLINPNGKFTIHWLPEENVGAYILSL